MLTERQKQIFAYLNQRKGCFIKGMELAEQLDCSMKTLQSTMKELKAILSAYDVEILSMPSRGYCLIVHESAGYERFCHELMEQTGPNNFNQQADRIVYILNELLRQDTYVKSDALADAMYVSRSAVSSDLKFVKKILQKYHLTIEHKPNYGMMVVGSEKAKRDCIIKEQLLMEEHQGTNKKAWISTISDVVVETLMKAKYRISDVVLQNLVLHIAVSIDRMRKDCYLQESTQLLQEYPHELDIAQKLLEKLSAIYDFSVKPEEVAFLALHLLGKRSYEEDDLINHQIDEFVQEMLDYIKEKTNIDFYGDMELRISLALHLTPLFIRLQHQLQLKNTMIKDIQSNYPLAYDVAVFAAAYLQEKTDCLVSEDEIGYLAVHFSLSLEKNEKKVNPKRVLIICNARRGDYLMMQHTFLKEFSEMIQDLKIINALEIPQIDLSAYDCIFATFLNHPLIPANALRINFFIDEKDIHRIQRALLGQSEQVELLKYFRKETFMGVIEAKDVQDVIQQMCDCANSYGEFYEALYPACMRREQLGGTSYGHRIALPHPDSLIAKRTIVITAILKKAILWSGQKVQLIFLICVEKGNQRDLQTLFECISKFMLDDGSVQTVIQKGDYQTFLDALGTLND